MSKKVKKLEKILDFFVGGIIEKKELNILKKLLGFCEKMFYIVSVVVLIILGVLLCIATGWLLRWMIWLGCFLIDFCYDWAIIDWIVEHKITMWIICSCLAPFVLIAEFMGSNSSCYTLDLKRRYSMNPDYISMYLSSIKSSVVFVDASGAYRKWDDDFIDASGNWVHL